MAPRPRGGGTGPLGRFARLQRADKIAVCLLLLLAVVVLQTRLARPTGTTVARVSSPVEQPHGSRGRVRPTVHDADDDDVQRPGRVAAATPAPDTPRPRPTTAATTRSKCVNHAALYHAAVAPLTPPAITLGILRMLVAAADGVCLVGTEHPLEALAVVAWVNPTVNIYYIGAILPSLVRRRLLSHNACVGKTRARHVTDAAAMNQVRCDLTIISGVARAKDAIKAGHANATTSWIAVTALEDAPGALHDFVEFVRKAKTGTDRAAWKVVKVLPQYRIAILLHEAKYSASADNARRKHLLRELNESRQEVHRQPDEPPVFGYIASDAKSQREFFDRAPERYRQFHTELGLRRQKQSDDDTSRRIVYYLLKDGPPTNRSSNTPPSLAGEETTATPPTTAAVTPAPIGPGHDTPDPEFETPKPRHTDAASLRNEWRRTVEALARTAATARYAAYQARLAAIHHVFRGAHAIGTDDGHDLKKPLARYMATLPPDANGLDYDCYDAFRLVGAGDNGTDAERWCEGKPAVATRTAVQIINVVSRHGTHPLADHIIAVGAFLSQSNGALSVLSCSGGGILLGLVAAHWRTPQTRREQLRFVRVFAAGRCDASAVFGRWPDAQQTLKLSEPGHTLVTGGAVIATASVAYTLTRQARVCDVVGYADGLVMTPTMGRDALPSLFYDDGVVSLTTDRTCSGQ